MPVDYSKYPPNWLTEIRPRIMKRAGNCCEVDGCNFQHLEEVWSVKRTNRPTIWIRSYEDALKVSLAPKKVKVIITIAHLDHDPENHEVQDDRLKAMCQLHHLRYDAEYKCKK